MATNKPSRPAVRKAEKKRLKGDVQLETKKNPTAYRQGNKQLQAIGGDGRTSPHSGNLNKKLVKRVNQSSIARTGKPAMRQAINDDGTFSRPGANFGNTYWNNRMKNR
jgi:hypothetical protein